jgi:hypothetical protein
MEKVVEIWLTSGAICKPVPPPPFEDILNLFSEGDGIFLVIQSTDNTTFRIPKHAIANVVTKKDPVD